MKTSKFLGLTVFILGTSLNVYAQQAITARPVTSAARTQQEIDADNLNQLSKIDSAIAQKRVAKKKIKKQVARQRVQQPVQQQQVVQQQAVAQYQVPQQAQMMTPAAAVPQQRAQMTTIQKDSMFKLVPIVGMTFSQLNGGQGNYSFSQRTGYLAGMEVTYGNGPLSLVSGLQYAERGSNEKYADPYSSYSNFNLEYKNKYLEIPAMIRYSLETSRSTTVFGKAGAVISMLQESDGSISRSSPYYSLAYADPSNTKSSFNTLETRWALGLGGTLRINSTISILLEGDYQQSFGTSSSSQPNGFNGQTTMDLSTTTYGFDAGLIFNI